MNYFADKQDLVDDILSRYPDSPQGKRSALMPLLREVQNAKGYVSTEHMTEIAALCGTTATEVRSVMSFYSTYHTVPTGKYHLQVCSTLMCALAGSDELWDHLVDELDVQAGEVSPDGRFSVQKVECLGSCGTAPMLQINDEGFYENVTPSKCKRVLEALRADKKPLPDNPVPVTVNSDGRQALANGVVVGANVDDLKPLPITAQNTNQEPRGGEK